MRNNKGFTLVELIVSVALLAIILVPTAAFFTNSFKTQSRSAQKSSITRVGQRIIEKFKNKEYLGLYDYNDSEKMIYEDMLSKNKKDKISSLDFSNLYFTANGGTEYVDDGNTYEVEIKLKGVKTSSLKNYNQKSKEECTCQVELNDDGTFSKNLLCKDGTASYIELIAKDTVYSTEYTANNPTILLKDGLEDESGISIWIENSYDGTLNIINKTSSVPEVYFEGSKLKVSSARFSNETPTLNQVKIYTPINALGNNSNKDSIDDAIFEAEMNIWLKDDSSISDNFSFSFPIEYDYSLE